MKRLVLIWFMVMASLMVAQAQIVEALDSMGMENIRMVKDENTIVLALENTIYRSSYTGISKALDVILRNIGNENVEVLIMENNIPQLYIGLDRKSIEEYRKGLIDKARLYEEMTISRETIGTAKRLHGVKRANSSAGKVDIVVYPQAMVDNNSLVKLFSYYINLSPALEMGLWTGAKLTVQAQLPVATNLQGQYKKIRPGYMTLAQNFAFGKNFYGNVAAGNFSNNRMGGHGELMWRSNNGILTLGAEGGLTVQSIIDDGWYVSDHKRIDGFVKAAVYEPHFNLQIEAKGGRYLYGDYGGRMDVTRHFGEFSIGLYGMVAGGKTNYGFHFAVPMPIKKWYKNRGVRVRTSNYFAMEYSVKGSSSKGYENKGESYNTRPDENRSNNFMNPAFVRYFMILEAQKEIGQNQ